MPADIMPPGFGIARVEETGTASHEMIYEHEYSPQPIRQHSATDSVPQENGVMLRPAVRNGKVEFRFFGNRVPLSGDHARSWMGHLLLQEQQKGRIERVELNVQRYQEILDLKMAGSKSAQRHKEQPSWLWDVWVTDPGAPAMKNGRMGRPSVEVLMKLSSTCGISIEIFCMEEAPRAEVYRILRQYCDDASGQVVWRPIPDPPAKISKVVDRALTEKNETVDGCGAPCAREWIRHAQRVFERNSQSGGQAGELRGCYGCRTGGAGCHGGGEDAAQELRSEPIAE